MRRRTVTSALWLLLAGCGGPTYLEMRPVDEVPPPPMGPKATAEEARGEVPPLRGLVDARRLVPPELIPPQPPPDPQPEFE